MPQESHPRQLEKHPAEESRALSFGPESLWYLERLVPNRAVYNVPFVSRLLGTLDVAAFQRALDALVERQEILRTGFPSSRGTPDPLVLNKRSLILQPFG